MASRPEHSQLLGAIAFAARAHRHHLRKDLQTPYVSHVFRVCLIVRHLFGIDDPDVLMAAVLHDTIEDTTTDFDDIREEFGQQVAEWVSILSKDKRLIEEDREQAYEAQLSRACWQVRLCKLADIYDNLTDTTHFSAEAKRRTLQRMGGYLKALTAPWPTPPVKEGKQAFEQALQIVQKLHKEMQKASAS